MWAWRQKDETRGRQTHHVRYLLLDVLKETVPLREGGSTVLDKIEGPQLTKRREQFLHLKKEKKKEEFKKYRKNKPCATCNNWWRERLPFNKHTQCTCMYITQWALTLTHTWFIEQRHLSPAQYVANPSLLAKLRTRNCKDLNHCNRNNMQTYKNKWCRWGDRRVMTLNRAHSETPKTKNLQGRKSHVYRYSTEKGRRNEPLCQNSVQPSSKRRSVFPFTHLAKSGPENVSLPWCNTQGVLYLEHLLGPSSFHDRIANPTELKTKLHVCITNFLTLAAKQERQWERKAERKKAGGREIILVL